MEKIVVVRFYFCRVHIHPTDAQTMFYRLFDNCSNSSVTTSRSNLERLSKLQKRAARIFPIASYDTATSDMFNT